MSYLKEILSGIVKQADEAAITNLTVGTQPSEAPDAPIGKKTKKKVMNKLLNGETPRAKIVEPKKEKRGDKEQKLEVADATAPEEINLEKAAELRMAMQAFGGLMQKQADVRELLEEGLSHLPIIGPRIKANARQSAAAEKSRLAAREAKSSKIRERTRKGIGYENDLAEEADEVADDYRNLAVGLGGGALAGAAGGAAYEQFKPDGAWAPSMITTTAGGAGLGLMAAMALNAMKKKKAVDAKSAAV